MKTSDFRSSHAESGESRGRGARVCLLRGAPVTSERCRREEGRAEREGWTGDALTPEPGGPDCPARSVPASPQAKSVPRAGSEHPASREMLEPARTLSTRSIGQEPAILPPLDYFASWSS